MTRFTIVLLGLAAGYAAVASTAGSASACPLDTAGNGVAKAVDMAQNVDIRALEPPVDVKDKQLRAQDLPGQTTQGRSIDGRTVTGSEPDVRATPGSTAGAVK